ncbi:MAG: hypothetical protein ACRETA_02840 [Gammaproteobacteria bacterium]
MKPSAVRELARRYAAGELSLEEYRTQRRNLIEAVTSGKQRLEYGQPTLSRIKRPQLHWQTFFISLTVLVAAGIGSAVWVSHSHNTDTYHAPTSTPVETGPSLVRSFVESNDWSDASVEQFMQHWRKLPRREQSAAFRSYLFPRMVSQLQEQVVSQRAMLELAPDRQVAEVHLKHLQHMAAALGANTED